jgi:hypothetical protein
MQILALSRRADGVTPEQLAPLAEAEAAAAYLLQARGIIRSAHMCPERPGAMLVLEADSLADASSHLATLPLVAAGLIGFDLSRMLPYTGSSALFATSYRSLA